MPGGYVDMAIAYSELNKSGDAIKSLKTAYALSKTSEDKYIVCYNLSAIYTNINKLDEALEYAKEAQQISNNDDIKELISNIEHAKQSKKRPFKSLLNPNVND